MSNSDIREQYSIASKEFIDKKDAKTCIPLVAVSSLTAVLLSSAFWVPTVYQLLHSTRMDATAEIGEGCSCQQWRCQKSLLLRNLSTA